jgi:hypothetical protein
VIEHVRAGETETVRVAYAPAPMGDVIRTTRTRADAAAGKARLKTATIRATRRNSTGASLLAFA